MSDKKELSKSNFDGDAADYDQSSKYSSVRSRYHHVVEEALHYDFQSWLDVGCGTGALLSLLGEPRKSTKLYGVDLSVAMIATAHVKLGEKADLRVADSEHLPYEDGKFDLITCTFSFHHYPNPQAVLLEMKRTLSPTGRIIIADAFFFFPLRQVMNLLSPVSREGRVSFKSRNEMIRLVRSAGLEVSKWSRLDWFAFLLVARR